jgi:O-antigen/teichoic acid export membrane protein
MAGSLPKRFQRNVGSNYAMTAASIVVAVVMTPVLVHGLGKTEYGVWALVGSLVWYLPLLEFGFGAATVKHVAQWQARGDGERVRATVATSFWLLCAAALVALVVAAGLALLFPVVFDLSSSVERAAQLLILIVAFDLACAMPLDTFGNVLVAYQRYDLLNATLVAVMLAQAAAWAVVLAAGGGLVALGLATVALSLCGQVARIVLARRISRDVVVARRFFDRALIRPLASLSAWFSLATWAQVVIQRLDVVVVGLVVGVPEAAVYAVAQKLSLLADQAILPLTRTFFPFSSEEAARRPLRELGGSVYAGTRVALLVAGPLCLGLAALADPALRAWVGDGFESGALVVVFLAGATAVKALTQVSVQMLLGTGHARRPALLNGAEAVLNLSLSVVLGRAMGIEGVALATLIAAATVHLLAMLPYATRTFGLGLASFLGGLARSHGPAALAGLVVALALRRTEPEGLAAVIACGAAIAAAYVGVFAVAGLEPGERRRLFARATEGR